MSRSDSLAGKLRESLKNALDIAEAAIECEDAHKVLDLLGAPAFSGKDETPSEVELPLAERIRRIFAGQVSR